MIERDLVWYRMLSVMGGGGGEGGEGGEVAGSEVWVREEVAGQ